MSELVPELLVETMYYLPPIAESPKRLALSFRCFWEEVAVHHGVEQPLPVLLGDIGNKPRIALPVEADLCRKSTLNEKVG